MRMQYGSDSEDITMKRFFSLVLALALLLSLAACGTTNTGESETPRAAEAQDADAASMKEAIEKLDGVTGVKVIEPAEGAVLFSERYLVTFEQPLDWNDPSVGTFEQRVAVDLCDGAEINVMETQGYCLADYTVPESEREAMNVLGMDLAPEMLSLVTKCGNYINVEHRFFGASRPADMSNTDTKYWEYHTPENAANDYHRIYTALAPLLGERWVSVGTSRGGLMTNIYAKYYPGDMDVYIPYVAPCSDGIDNDNMYRFVYEEAGNDTFGKEKAEEYRGIVTAFQVELMKYKEMILPNYSAYIEESGLHYQNGSEDFARLYDLNVLEFAVQSWQYKSKQNFDALKAILDMPEDTNEQKNERITELYQTLLNTQRPEDWSYDTSAWPYYVNTATYYGQYLYDFSYLREALEKAGVENTLSVSPEEDKEIPWSIVFTPEQREAFVYDGTFRKELTDDMKTTQAKHLMIFGATDPWFSQAVPEEITASNENIRRFVNPDYPHDATISNMPEDTKNEIVSLLKEWLSAE